MTPLIPPNYLSFAYKSPIVLDTDSLPGKILSGPMIVSFLLCYALF